MTITRTQRILYSAIAGVVAVLFILLLAPHYPSHPRGLLLPSGKTAIPVVTSSVKLYRHFPAISERLGLIRIEQHSSQQPNLVMRQMIAKVRRLAAKAGANGVVVKIFGHSGAGAPAGLSAYVFYGEAIYTPRVPARLPL